MVFTCGFGEYIGFLKIYLEPSFAGATGINQSTRGLALRNLQPEFRIFRIKDLRFVAP